MYSKVVFDQGQLEISHVFPARAKGSRPLVHRRLRLHSASMILQVIPVRDFKFFFPFFFFLFILFAYCLRLKPVRRNSSKEIVGSGSIRIFLFLFFFLFFSLGNGIKLRMESKWKRWTCRTLNVRSSYDYAIPFLANFIRNNRMCLNTRVDKIWNWKLNNPCIRVCRG